MIAVTGGAGFIGSAIIEGLNRRGLTDILAVDDVGHPEKKKNLSFLKYKDLLSKDEFRHRVRARSLPPLDTIFHMGASSSTTETNEEFLRSNNFEYTRDLATFALEKGVRFIYASSAATYGNGSQGYSDDESLLDRLQPLNPYGKSKHMFDLWARDQGVLRKMVGLKYFNVYGPNEYHKGNMQSMVRRGYFQVKETGKIRLFKSYKPEFSDGGQERDFIYVKDVVDMVLFFMDQRTIGGIFNVGYGKSRCWNDLARAVFTAMGRELNIEYIEMPENIKPYFQYFTCAEIKKIRKSGYEKPLTSLEDGARDYIQNYLIPGKRLGE